MSDFRIRTCSELGECETAFYKEGSCGLGEVCLSFEGYGNCEDSNPNSALTLDRLCPADVLDFGPPSGPIALGDLTGDGLPDLVFIDGGLRLSTRTNGTPRFRQPASITPSAVMFALGDLDGDGGDEVVQGTTTAAGVELSFVRNSGNARFTTTPLGVTLAGPAELRVRELDGSGHADVIALEEAGRLTVLLDPVNGGRVLQRDLVLETHDLAFLQGGTGRATLVLDTGPLVGITVGANGGLVEAELVPDPERHVAMLVEDFNLDGSDDLALVAPPDKLLVHWGSGTSVSADAAAFDFPVGDDTTSSFYASSAGPPGGGRVIALRRDGALVAIESDGQGSFFPQSTFSFAGLARGSALAIGDPSTWYGLVVSTVTNPNRPTGYWNPTRPQIVVPRQCQ